MNIRYTYFIFFFAGYLLPAHGMSSANKDSEVVLCGKAEDLPASEDFKSDIEHIHIFICYGYLLELAEKQREMMQKQFASTIKNVGGSIFGGSMKWMAQAFGIDKVMVDGMIEHGPDVSEIFKHAQFHDDNISEEDVSILSMLQKESLLGDIDKALPKQTASLCVGNVIDFIDQNQGYMLKAIKKHRLNEESGNKALSCVVSKALDFAVPKVMSNCVANKKSWQMCFAQMADKTSLKQLLEQEASFAKASAAMEKKQKEKEEKPDKQS